jgi:hypothetical protein
MELALPEETRARIQAAYELMTPAQRAAVSAEAIRARARRRRLVTATE